MRKVVAFFEGDRRARYGNTMNAEDYLRMKQHVKRTAALVASQKKRSEFWAKFRETHPAKERDDE